MRNFILLQIKWSRLVLLVAFMLLVVDARAQKSPTWANLRRVSADLYSMGDGIAIAADGSQYVTGQFDGTLALGNITLKAGASAPSTTHVFLAKYAASGEVLWAKKIDPPAYMTSHVAVDASGNAYLAGNFSKSITVGNTTLTTTSSDAYLVKYNAQGIQQWAKQGMGGSHTNVSGVVTDPDGNVAIAGDFKTTVSFGGSELTDGGIFYYKFSSAGAILKATSVSKLGGSWMTVRGLKLDKQGNAYITGEFAGALTVGANTVNSGAWDIFLCKLNAAGVPLWGKAAGGSGNELSGGVAVDEAGNAVVCGYSDQENTLVHTKIYLARFTTDGMPDWEREVATSTPNPNNGYGFTHAADVAYDGNGGYLVTGAFIGQAAFGTTTLSAPSPHVFVARYDSKGNAVWARQAVGFVAPTDHGFATSMTVDHAGNAYVIGSVWGDAAFGDLKTYANYTTCVSGLGVFIAKLTTSSALDTHPGAPSPRLDMYPNPASGSITVAVPAGGGRLVFFDAKGSIVREQALAALAGEYVISLTGLAPGLYQLRASMNNGQTKNAKLVVL